VAEVYGLYLCPVEGPFQKIADPTLEDLKRCKWPKASEIENFTNWRKKRGGFARKAIRPW